MNETVGIGLLYFVVFDVVEATVVNSPEKVRF
jgi:hypothetical protein